ncbi:MAG: hypothetical protein R3C15_16690 [Thermoleophilia bacterium]
MANPRDQRLRTFLLGGLLGGVAGLVAADRLDRRLRRPAPADGLAAFEQAPCFREQRERPSGEHQAPAGD